MSIKDTTCSVLFQNADGNINMGLWFNDPDVEFDDIYWYNCLDHNSYRSSRVTISEFQGAIE